MEIDLSTTDFAEITPEQFARTVKSASKDELTEALRGPHREQILDAVFDRMGKQFRPDLAGGLTALIRWEIIGSTPLVYEVSIGGGACTTSKGRSDDDARVTLNLADADFVKLVSGNAGGPMLFMTRKMRVDGDLGLAAGLTRYFDIPRA